MVEAKNKESSHWWWFDSHNKGNSNRSPWLQSTLADLDEKTKTMLKLIEEDADSFAQRAEMYYKKRPELISMVEDFYRTHRSLAERYDQSKSETRLITPWSSPLPFTKYRLEKSLSLIDKTYDSYSDEAYGPEEESDESEVDDPEEEEEQQQQKEQHPVEYETEEVLRLRQELERLREENKVQKDEIMRKDEEKREVIRQLSLGMDLLRDENLKLRQCIAMNNTPKKENRVEYNKLKDGFLGRLFDGFGKSSANLVAL
ncbi:hypothetical protein DH2020_024948 [Rehmannia glutinosa]|uniref:NAB domain-containing protein n=1 Tax=Rehmannia glutinosa TaxID=99300 RepID=A0ABR0W4Z1_REHGL